MNFDTLCARDLMRTDIKTIKKEITIPHAVRDMRGKKVSSLIIEPDDERDAYGIITRKDIVELIVMDPTGWIALTVEDLMSKPAITVSPSLSITNCQQLMRMAGVRRLPVVEGQKLEGILSNSNIFFRLSDSF